MKRKLPYNESSKESVLDYAYRLQNKTLREVIDLSLIEEVDLNKGKFGQLLESKYFFKDLDSESQPDFPLIPLELKSSPLKTLVRNNAIRAKERLVLNIINYEKLVQEDFANSSLMRKNSKLLLVFYLHDKEKNLLDFKIQLVGIWEFPIIDLKIIEHDWNLIYKKVQQGQAHTLSEGDTIYLGACTKGANSSSVRSQPNSPTSAKQRAFSLKTGYVNHIIATLSNTLDGSFGKIFDSEKISYESIQNFDFEKEIIRKLEFFYGKSAFEIAKSLNVIFSTYAKDNYSRLIKKILSGEEKEIQELIKADITIKTIRLDINNMPKENLSFSAFRFTEIIKEENWEESSINATLEKKFLFIFFKESNADYILDKAFFWNMPYEDRIQVSEVWTNTKSLITQGKIVSSIKQTRDDKFIYRTYFPKQSDHPIAHVRPHASRFTDTYELPVADQTTGKTAYMRHSFWLNKQYIRYIYLKNSKSE